MHLPWLLVFVKNHAIIHPVVPSFIHSCVFSLIHSVSILRCFWILTAGVSSGAFRVEYKQLSLREAAQENKPKVAFALHNFPFFVYKSHPAKSVFSEVVYHKRTKGSKRTHEI